MTTEAVYTFRGPAMALLKASLTGVGGTLVVVLFLTGLIPVSRLSAVLPWVVGFNGALAGYRLVEFLKGGPFHKKAVSFLPGMITGALAWCSLNISFFYGVGAFIFSTEELLLHTVISGFTGYLGAGLASRYLDL
jgi:hypothetical protein